MSVCTLGLYNVYWSYHQWSRIKAETSEPLSPALRALLSPLWNFSLFSRVQAAADDRALPREWSALLLGSGYLLLQIASTAPPPMGFIAILSFVPLVFVQQTIIQVNKTAEAQEGSNNHFTSLDIFAIMGAWVLLMILRALLPVPG